MFDPYDHSAFTELVRQESQELSVQFILFSLGAFGFTVFPIHWLLGNTFTALIVWVGLSALASFIFMGWRLSSFNAHTKQLKLRMMDEFRIKYVLTAELTGEPEVCSCGRPMYARSGQVYTDFGRDFMSIESKCAGLITGESDSHTCQVKDLSIRAELIPPQWLSLPNRE